MKLGKNVVQGDDDLSYGTAIVVPDVVVVRIVTKRRLSSLDQT